VIKMAGKKKCGCGCNSAKVKKEEKKAEKSK
jgi:hypothetical protein